MEIYETNKFGLKNITPSIIIDENSITGDFEVYSVNKFGLKNISPDEIIENDEYNGTWRVYRVNNFGLKDIIPEQVAKELGHSSVTTTEIYTQFSFRRLQQDFPDLAESYPKTPENAETDIILTDIYSSKARGSRRETNTKATAS